MRDWVGVVDRINAILAKAQRGLPNVLDDPAQLAEFDQKAATHVKICLAFCMGLLTNAQHKRLFWDFTVRVAERARKHVTSGPANSNVLTLILLFQHVKRLLGAADPGIVQLALEVLFAYSVRNCRGPC
jgi:hypothetical protein